MRCSHTAGAWRCPDEAEPGFKRCEKHILATRRACAALKARRLADGRCIWCGRKIRKRKSKKPDRHCAKHRELVTTQARAYYQRKREKRA